MRDYALLHVNGVPREVRGREALMMLATWLRKEAGLPGTKIVCAEGDCGACTVLRAFDTPGTESLDAPFEVMNSCIAIVAQMDGAHIVTVEGMQDGDALAPAQEAMRRCHGSQCGFCTPGFVMALSGMLEQHGGVAVERKVAANHLTGNLCRCTGYEPILEAACTVRTSPRHVVGPRYGTRERRERARAAMQDGLQIEHDGVRFAAPTSLREACAFVAAHPGCRVVGASTDLGVPINKGRPMPEALLSLHLIPELHEARLTRSEVVVGARVPLAKVRHLCEQAAPEFARFLNLFASPQIKNVATLVGNIATGSPIGDTLPFLLVSNAMVHVASRPGGRGAVQRREIPMTRLYRGYRQLALEPGELITHVSFERTRPKEVVRLFKVSQRKDLDISTVSAAFALTLAGPRTKGSRQVTEARVALGGVAATPIRLPEVEKALVGTLDAARIEPIAALIGRAIAPLSDVRGTAAYRTMLAANLFRQFAQELLDG
ncbi:MAG: 2Fe-2S iron-sulfur cluster binding domain-containing protein [Planctomycetes bacterium]|nr:2Fe-2S iron-sulfur cluster binding domain-containing protein [Planctomycetota bacterium]